MITFWIGRNPTVWICDAWAASELLDKRAGIYASRPRMVVFGELGPGQTNLVSMYYGQRWRVHRKLTHMGVGLQQVRNYRGFQNDESMLVAYNILQTPDDYEKHFERYAASVVSIIGFGRRIASTKDPIISEVLAVMQRAAELNVPGKTFPMLMETFPCKLHPSKIPEEMLTVLDQFWRSSQRLLPHGSMVLAARMHEEEVSTIRLLKKQTTILNSLNVTSRNFLMRRHSITYDQKKLRP